jgi:hypothetical protein
MVKQEFGDWLRDRPEFDYIVDAANIAYYGQNFETGKFSYRQVCFFLKYILRSFTLH